MLSRMKDEWQMFIAILSVSEKLLVSFLITIFSPSVAMLASLLIPTHLQGDLAHRMFGPMLAAIRELVPLAALLTFIYFCATTIGVYLREKDRLLA